MSSHHDWVEEVIAQHDLEKPFAPENGTPLAFNPGDSVIYTNDYGGQYVMTVVAHYKPTFRCSLYACGFRYLLNSSSPWMPVKESSLRQA